MGGAGPSPHSEFALGPAATRRQILIDRLMLELGCTVPALPVSLAALALLRMPGRALTAFELKGEVHELMARLERRGAYIHIPRRDREYAVNVGVRTLLQRHIILEKDGQYRVNSGEMPLLAYYANAIAHLDRVDAPVAVAVPMPA